MTNWDLVVAKKLNMLSNEFLPKRGKSPNRYIELRGVDASMIFLGAHRTIKAGRINIYDLFYTKEEYIRKELDWYNSQSLDAKWIGSHAKIWLQCCDDKQKVNSNYGFLIFSAQNGYQFKNVLSELIRNPDSRRAIAYYANPFLHYTGGKDHICTIAVQYLINGEFIDAVVFMRSNDIVYGLIGADLFWQNEVLSLLCDTMMVENHRTYKPGNIHWMCGSLHIYERHWDKLVEFKEKFKQEDFNVDK